MHKPLATRLQLQKFVVILIQFEMLKSMWTVIRKFGTRS